MIFSFGSRICRFNRCIEILRDFTDARQQEFTHFLLPISETSKISKKKLQHQNMKYFGQKMMTFYHKAFTNLEYQILWALACIIFTNFGPCLWSLQHILWNIFAINLYRIIFYISQTNLFQFLTFSITV